MEIRYEKDRLRDKLTYGDMLSLQSENGYLAVLAGYAALLWDEETQSYYPFEEAKTLLLSSSMKTMEKLAEQLTSELRVAQLFAGAAKE